MKQENLLPRISLESIGLKVLENRGDRGVREVAKEIGLSPATLSRVERGHIPDLETFSKICRWLRIDPAIVLGMDGQTKPPVASIQTHFRKDDAVQAATATALADLIVKAHKALILMNEQKGESLELV